MCVSPIALRAYFSSTAPNAPYSTEFISKHHPEKRQPTNQGTRRTSGLCRTSAGYYDRAKCRGQIPGPNTGAPSSVPAPARLQQPLDPALWPLSLMSLTNPQMRCPPFRGGSHRRGTMRLGDVLRNHKSAPNVSYSLTAVRLSDP